MSQGTTTLATLIAEFNAERLERQAARTEARHQEALRRFGWYLGAEPTVDHLTKDELVLFLLSLGRVGFERRAVEELAYAIRAVWRQCFERGITDEVPPQRPILPEGFRTVSPGKKSLVRYVEEVYAPAYRETHPAPSAETEIDRAVTACNRLGYMLGRHAQLVDLNEATFKRFAVHMLNAGASRHSAHRCATILRQVARHHNPDLFKARFQGWRGATSVDDEGPGTLRHYFETVYAPHKLRDTKAATKRYRIALRHFARFLGRPPVLADLNDVVVTDFVHSLPLNAQTVNSYRANLICLWGYAFRKRMVEFGPDVNALKETRQAPVSLTMEQLGRLFRAAKEYDRPKGGICGIPSRDYWFSLVMALYDTGLRLSAIQATRVADLDLSSDCPSLFVHGEHQKTGKYARRPLHRDTAAVLRRTLEAVPDRDLIWPWDYEKRYFFSVAKPMFTAARIDIKRKQFHLLRRTAATQVAKIFDVEKSRQYLQHTTVTTTLEHYIDADQLDDDIRRMCDLLPRPELLAATAGGAS